MKTNGLIFIYKNVNFYLILVLFDDTNDPFYRRLKPYKNFLRSTKIYYKNFLRVTVESFSVFSRSLLKKKKKNCFDRRYWYKVDDEIHAACETF